jgi:type I restriction enzyme S subunit
MKQGWELKKMGEVLTFDRGGSPLTIEKYMTNSPDGINWIKISDATASDKYIYETKEKITKDGLHKTRIVNEGDFILSNSMSFGRPYIMKITGCIHDGWLVLKQNGKKIFETEFLYYLLSSPFVFHQFNSKAAGSTVRNLNIALVSSVDVPIPPLHEQQRIVAILDEAFAFI